MMPVRNIATPSHVRHDQMLLGFGQISFPQLLHRPTSGLDCTALHVLVPEKGTIVFAARVIRETRLVVAEKHDVVIAAGSRAAAPFLYRITDETTGRVEGFHRV